ncbi:hypothetical protein CDN99_07235 [Roseateles aquatilis]|uniref:Transglycosylase SLT domain-containing protein n=1 Tax=Roseateles aquatilis TaxID=431061 RepID=A0A246JHM1_9BURK|nr:lytic transglycosylase domain-containing protein [Roseateles aquatilis]OWQ92137.1 hypothetical protein CDN99_07235 [Roseateles aquatilis]
MTRRARSVFRAGALGAMLLLATVTSRAMCFEAAGQRYGVSPLLLRAVARQESNLNPRASHRNADGSTDIGLMQINSSWVPTLARYGVHAHDLWDPCANAMVGAWILASNFRRMGDTAMALGAYNAQDPQKRLAYARQVLRHYARLKAEEEIALGAAAPSLNPTPTPARRR